MTPFRSRHTLALSSLAVAALAVAGCSSPESQPTASTASMTSTPSATTTSGKPLAAAVEGTLTAAPTERAPQTAQASPEAALTITDIRVGAHDGFDRVVYELAGTGTPGWRADVMSAATQQGSGKPLAVAGQGVLQVMITGAAMPFTTGVTPYAGPNPLEVAQPGAVTEVRDAGTFEGTAQTVIGLTNRNADYRVFTLSDPTRVVVDVAR